MTCARPDVSFSLAYELQPGDIADIATTSPARKRRRIRLIGGLAAWAPLAAAFTAVTVALDRPSVVKDSPGAPAWMYGIDVVTWLLAGVMGIAAWRLSPNRLARRAWRKSPRDHGRHRDELSPAGVTSISPDGSEHFSPWTTLARVLETNNAFHLLTDDESFRHELPKRGLPSPDLIPALREFLNHSVGRQPPAAAQSTAAPEPTP